MFKSINILFTRYLQFGVFFCFIVYSGKSFSQWISDPSLNNPICTDTTQQYAPQIVTDGQGGAIIVWKDCRDGNWQWDIYAQRIDINGNILWTYNGLSECTYDFTKVELKVVSDSSGGAILVWTDDSDSISLNIYAQRIDGSGNKLWSPNNIEVCNAVGEQNELSAAVDGQGGVIIGWVDKRWDGWGDIYIQRLDENGTILWDYNGIPIIDTIGPQERPSVLADGHGGAYISWSDIRDQYQETYDIFSQHVDSSGICSWHHYGVPVSTANENQYEPKMCTDGSGGFIVSWTDYRNVDILPIMPEDIYAQRVGPGGNCLWTYNGIPVAVVIHKQTSQNMVPDGVGGVFFTWSDNRNDPQNYIYAQHINSVGEPIWLINGLPIAPNSHQQNMPNSITDNIGGTITCWSEFDTSGTLNIRAQRMDFDGNAAWLPYGRDVCIAPQNQNYALMVSDGHDGAIATWEDRRFPDGMHYDIYAQNINGAGVLGGVIGIPSYTDANLEILTYPNPSNGIFNVVLKGDIFSNTAQIRIYNTLGEMIYSNTNFSFQTNAIDISTVQPGIYFLELENSGNKFVQKISVE